MRVRPRPLQRPYPTDPQGPFPAICMANFDADTEQVNGKVARPRRLGDRTKRKPNTAYNTEYVRKRRAAEKLAKLVHYAVPL